MLTLQLHYRELSASLKGATASNWQSWGSNWQPSDGKSSASTTRLLLLFANCAINTGFMFWVHTTTVPAPPAADVNIDSSLNELPKESKESSERVDSCWIVTSLFCRDWFDWLHFYFTLIKILLCVVYISVSNGQLLPEKRGCGGGQTGAPCGQKYVYIYNALSFGITCTFLLLFISPLFCPRIELVQMHHASSVLILASRHKPLDEFMCRSALCTHRHMILAILIIPPCTILCIALITKRLCRVERISGPKI